MTSYSRALIPLCDCLRGSLPKNPNWMAILGLANQTLTTTSLMPFVEQFGDRIPDDVNRYVREMFERNLRRNSMLSAQLEETVEALNQAGVTPILLKGAAMLATSPPLSSGKRLMSDLDILVAPSEAEAAMSGLSDIGYSVHYQTSSEAAKWYADLKRTNDVGMVDLHSALPGPAFFYPPIEERDRYYRTVQIGGSTGSVPSTTFHALIMIIHDQFQDSDYWTGDIDLRHMLNLRDLSLSAEGIDWDLLFQLTPNKLARNALDTQLVGLSVLFGVDIPTAARQRPIARLQFKRRLAQARFPALRPAFLSLAVLDYRSYRNGVGDSLRTGDDGRPLRLTLPKRSTLRHLLELSGQNRVGKV